MSQAAKVLEAASISSCFALRFQPVNMNLEGLEAIFERLAVGDQRRGRLVFEQFLRAASFVQKVKRAVSTASSRFTVNST